MLSSLLFPAALAALCAVFGFTGVAGALAWIPQAMFTLFVGTALVSLAVGLLGRSGRQTRTPV